MRPVLFLLLALTGCSSVSVLQERENTALAPRSRPSALYVQPFEVRRGAEFDAAAAKPDEDPREKVAAMVVEGILSRADELVAPGRRLEAGAKPPAEGLLVAGKILRTSRSRLPGKSARRSGLRESSSRSCSFVAMGCPTKSAWRPDFS